MLMSIPVRPRPFRDRAGPGCRNPGWDQAAASFLALAIASSMVPTM